MKLIRRTDWLAVSATRTAPGHSGLVVRGVSSTVGWARRSAGFTLLELLVVVVIIGLLAGLVAPRYFDQVGRSNTQIARAQIDALEKALDQYRLDMGTYPTSDQGLQALVVKPEGSERWQGPYLKKSVPPDPWGRPYRYRGPGEHGDYDLYSFGADGQAGGTGENIDVASWELMTKAAR
jgi:general secretion pathway protein G